MRQHVERRAVGPHPVEVGVGQVGAGGERGQRQAEVVGAPGVVVVEERQHPRVGQPDADVADHAEAAVVAAQRDGEHPRVGRQLGQAATVVDDDDEVVVDALGERRPHRVDEAVGRR